MVCHELALRQGAHGRGGVEAAQRRMFRAEKTCRNHRRQEQPRRKIRARDTQPHLCALNGGRHAPAEAADEPADTIPDVPLASGQQGARDSARQADGRLHPPIHVNARRPCLPFARRNTRTEGERPRRHRRRSVPRP